jgi:hypothetical protein
LGNQTRFGNSSKRSGKNWDLTLSRIAIGWSDPVWKFIQTIGENWDLRLVKSQLDNQTWFGNSSKQSGKNWDLTLSRIAIGWSDPVWKFIQTVGEKLGFETFKSQLGGQTWFGSGKNWDLTLSRIAIGWSDPVWKFIQTIGEKLGFDT